MNRGPRFSCARLVALLPLVLLLLGGMVAGALHHHEGTADNCAVCVHAGTPATSVAALPSVPVPVLTTERLPLFAVRTPIARVLRALASRGPPTA